MERSLLVLLCVSVAVSPGTGRMLDNGKQNGFDSSEKVSGKSHRWKTGNWGICFSGRGPNSCGQGTRERPVWCVDEDGVTVLEFLCDSKREPERTRSCFTACRHHKDKLKWDVGQWGPCVEAETKMNLTLKPGTEEHYGLMQRNVTCILVSHDDVKLRLTVDEENCFTIARKPDPARLCSIPKAQDCVVTEFTKWSPCRGCHPNAHQTRIRNVLVAPKNGGKSCPDLAETRTCPAKTECLRRSHNKTKREFRLKVSAWSECEVPSSQTSAEEGEYRFGNHLDGSLPISDVSVSAESSEKQTIFHAQVGYQTRTFSCKDSKGAVVDLSMCHVRLEDLPTRIRACIVPHDCIVSDWSTWTKVEEGCVEDTGVIRAEVHERRRQVIRLSEGNGQPCPHLHEKKEISNKESLPPCKNKFKRILSKWSDCIIPSGKESVKVGCGGGIQLRTISCVSVSSGQPVEDSQCSSSDGLEQLPTVQRCEVACPRDCVVGEWGKWGPCSRSSCSGNVTLPAHGYRTRKRSVLIQPSVKGVPCPAVTEVQPCSNVYCFRWSPGHWGTCTLKSPGKCGLGFRRRNVKCVDLEKNVVEDYLCLDKDKPVQEEPCSLPCPFDCVLSPWSEWSPCSHSCSGEKMVALKQRNRTIIAPPGPGGQKCPNPDELMEMEPCNTHSCHGYSWMILPWQPCMSEEGKLNVGNIQIKPDIMKNPELLDMYLRGEKNESSLLTGEEDGEGKTCGTGTKTREVWCVEDNNIRVGDARCYPVEKPTVRETCVKECPVDCQLSPWAEWSVCPQECVPDASNEVKDGEVAPTQTRSRVIMRNPTSGGMPCRHLDEFRPCPLSAARCKHYQWQLSEWSTCQLPANLKCGEGFRTRGVWCSKNQRTTKVSPTFCVENEGPPPVLGEKCTVDCQRHCVLSEWSPWSKCSSSCRGETSRYRQLLGTSASRVACLNSDLYPLRERKSCPCEEYNILTDEHWSTCILDHALEKKTCGKKSKCEKCFLGDTNIDNKEVGPKKSAILQIIANGRPVHDSCGSGTRYKRNVCTNAAGEIVEPSFCELENSLIEEPCIIPCPVDCVQTQWSTWGECSSLCGPGLQNRTREIIQDPREGGRPCGTNLEVKVCNTPCSKFRWASSGYTQCALKSHDEFRGCGTGEQSRTVRCLEYGQSGTATQVRDEYCDPVKRPEYVSQCHVSCPGDCVVSPWSDWSECDESCSSSKLRERTRVLLRSPSQEGTKGRECPNLIQVQNCQINVTCFTYEWKATPYGSCLPLGGSPCGEGVQTRAVFCQRSDGRSVADDFCNHLTKPAGLEKWCYVGCPIDCELTPWSKWNDTECVCGSSIGFQYRRRKIASSPSSSGRPCSSVLEQRKPCTVKPCYNWRRGPWSTCVLEGAACGHGISYRNVTCLRGNVVVDTKQCLIHKNLNSELSEIELSALDLNTETNCYTPCHGDCELSEWSQWSHCHRNCYENPTGGYQTRSRAILRKSSTDGESCPTTLWETRPCNVGDCLTFEWYIEGENIVCRRSDGILVMGGCEENRKPCFGNCSLVKHSRCVAGSCACVDGFRPFARTGSRSIDCISTKEGVSINQKFEDTMADEEDMLRSRLLYLPSDEFNIWMFAMIGIGCLFVVFVAVSFYLMCHNSTRSSQENGTQVLNVNKP